MILLPLVLGFLEILRLLCSLGIKARDGWMRTNREKAFVKVAPLHLPLYIRDRSGASVLAKLRALRHGEYETAIDMYMLVIAICNISDQLAEAL